MDERVLPHSLDAEKAVLGAILIEHKAWPVAASVVAASDFYRDAHKRIFETMALLEADGIEVDMITLRTRLKSLGLIEEVGGPAYLSSLPDGVPRSSNVQYYAAIVRDKARLRYLILETSSLLATAYEDSKPAGEIIDATVERLLNSLRVEAGGAIPADEAMRAYAASLSDGTAAQAVPTGFADLDRLIDGFRPSDLVIVAARPSVGKTSLALRMARSMARTTGKVVPFFSLEMSVSGLVGRILSWDSGVPSPDIRRGSASQEQYTAIAEAVAAFEDNRLVFISSVSSLSEVSAWCHRLTAEHGPLGGAVIDYIQLMIPEASAHKNAEAEMAGISRGTKRLARDLAIPIVALSQLSRAPEGRADKRPQLSDLRGSGALEQDTDMALFLFRPEMHQRTQENDGIAEVIVGKNRDGPTGIVRLYFNKELAMFCDLVPETAPPEQEY